jgi:PhzF family phenazine biosynthesis protein
MAAMAGRDLTSDFSGKFRQMRTPIFKLDAFTKRRFSGNPAAVMPLAAFPPHHVMQAIAAENNLAETAFFVREGSDFRLRWFTPSVEVPLCGHATLASAAVVMERLEPARKLVVFHSKSGPLTVTRAGDAYVMDFPSRPTRPIAPPSGLTTALGVTPVEILADSCNYLAVLEHPELVRRLTPDLASIARLDRSGVIVTAPGDGTHDCVSRYFAPAKGIPEDPVTGGAHCALTPYWARRLGKTEIRAWQASARGGEMICRLSSAGDRVELEGYCVFFLEGEAEIDAEAASAPGTV